MPVAEIKIRTTHDGTQAERSLDNLEKKVDKLGKTMGGKLQSAALSFFSIEKVLQFTSAISESIVKMEALVDKVRSGKATIDEVSKESGVSKYNLGTSAAIGEASGIPTKGKWDNFVSRLTRYAIGGVGSMGGLPLITSALDSAGVGWASRFETMRAHALMGDLGTLDSAGMEGKVANQRARNEARRQQAIKELIDREMSGPEGGGQGFNPVTGRYFGPGLPSSATQQAHRSIELERQSLDELRRISNILDRSPSTNSGTAFPQ